MRRLPVGIQSFEDIRKNGYIYVDKTEYIWNLVNKGKVYFLSRPRRFGKSLFISTLEAYFQGKKELFEGLTIEKNEEEKGKSAWQKYPVIKFSLSGGDYLKEGGLADMLEGVLEENIHRYALDGIYEVTGETLARRFKELIRNLYEKTGKQVVVLVDEYDKPLIETMETHPDQEEKNRLLYKGFFSILKDQDQYLKFVFFTGVTKFSKVSVFSDLNQLTDISLRREYSGLCGITERELLDNFNPEIKGMASNLEINMQECIRELADMYDGYHFSAEADGVYNPYSLLNAFQDRELSTYWFDTGTPTFLVRMLRNSKITTEQLTDGVEIDEMTLKNYRPESRNPIPLFYQTGYLTICGFDREFRIYSLEFPNREVKYGFLNFLSQDVFGTEDSNGQIPLRRMILDLKHGEVNSFLKEIEVLFAGIPYPEGAGIDYEREWRNQIYLLLALMGQKVKCEVHSAKGRADCIVETENHVYVFEFKVDDSADAALRQIEEKGYAKPYLKDARKVLKIGVNFSSEERNIVEWKVQ